jgi:hypothetical protein
MDYLLLRPNCFEGHKNYFSENGRVRNFAFKTICVSFCHQGPAFFFLPFLAPPRSMRRARALLIALAQTTRFFLITWSMRRPRCPRPEPAPVGADIATPVAPRRGARVRAILSAALALIAAYYGEQDAQNCVLESLGLAEPSSSNLGPALPA